MTENCPSCERPASGRFCSHCGTALTAPATCVECSAELVAGARFCTSCGTGISQEPQAVAATASPAPGRANLPWVVAGAAVLALAAFNIAPLLRGDAGQSEPAAAAFAPPAGAASGGPGAVDLSSMTPREAADRLFDRIMRSVSSGDTTEARAFLPMAFGAYGRLDELDTDAKYHLGVLHLLAGEPVKAREQADAILAGDPSHLFGLMTAAQAERDLGNQEAARSFYRRFLDAYPNEVERELPEYQAHAPALPEMRAEAQTGSGAGSQ